MSGYWRDKRVLVTGATGVVGSWVVEALLDGGAQVAALVRDHDQRSHFYRSGAVRSVTVVDGSLEDFGAVERAIAEHEADTVIHLGAQTIVPTAQRLPLPTFEANIRGTYNLLEACRRHADLVKRVVIASSDKAYGDHGRKAYEEGAPLSAKHPYDVSKACADLLTQTYAWSYGLPAAIARCGNIYGGGDLNWSRIVPGTIRSLIQAERPVLRSDGSYVRDYLYVKDAAAGYLLLAEH
ncbi:MAG TPA: NAD-dependent epimerase/dehydratase family protein, partial [Chloroflexota bacterium]